MNFIYYAFVVYGGLDSMLSDWSHTVSRMLLVHLYHLKVKESIMFSMYL